MPVTPSMEDLAKGSDQAFGIVEFKLWDIKLGLVVGLLWKPFAYLWKSVCESRKNKRLAGASQRLISRVAAGRKDGITYRSQPLGRFDAGGGDSFQQTFNFLGAP